jgi:choline dehydrogenase-like flavoprotein
MLAEPPLSTGFNLKPHVAQPQSEGTVELLSPDPRAKPRIDPRYLSDPVKKRAF